MGMDNGLNKMFRMDAAHAQMKTNKERVHPVTEEEIELGEHDRSLSDIFQDKEEQDRFLNSFCATKNKAMSEEIAKALIEKTEFTPEQNKFLETMRSGYNLRRAEAERVREMLDENEIQRIARLDPKIQQVVGKIGAEKAAELLGREFEKLAIVDEAAFRKVVKQMRSVREIGEHESVKALQQSVDDALRKYGISEDKYWEATQTGTTTETQQNLVDLAKQQYGWFRSAIDFATKGKLSREAGAKLYANFEDQRAVINECNKHLKVVGGVLQGTLTPEVNLAIQKAMLEGGEVQDHRVENNVTTVQDYRRVKEESDPSKVATLGRWDKYTKEQLPRELAKMKKHNLAALTAAERGTLNDSMKGSFAKAEMDRRKGYRIGDALAALVGFLLGSGLADETDIKNELTDIK
jgi:hypothetical protein